ncbi:UNVERIFIED_CONTAM: hypothetical protein Sangu_1879400 [Sesamum angustifolium]|uniref:Uncharacterized protein n=1 Tax=Sesamum angustifolium TaxID=2727405 RepID=A0AAW2LXL0_9LAMI
MFLKRRAPVHIRVTWCRWIGHRGVSMLLGRFFVLLLITSMVHLMMDDDHIFERIHDRISQLTDHKLPLDYTWPLDYYNANKLIKDLGLPIEKIDACKNSCILYWKDDIDLNYCKFCGEVRYKPTRERNPISKKTPYAILRYLSLTPRLQRLYTSEPTAKQMTWHANHRRRTDPYAIRLMQMHEGILIGHTPILQ